MFGLLSFECEKMAEGMQLLGGSPLNTVLLIVFSVIIGAGLFLLFNLLFKWLWNKTLPKIFVLKEITFWQSFRLLIIVSLIFGGFGGGH